MDGCVDNPVAQKLLIRQLQRHGLNVIATSNGEEAIAGNRLVLFVTSPYRFNSLPHF